MSFLWVGGFARGYGVFFVNGKVFGEKDYEFSVGLGEFGVFGLFIKVRSF